MAEDFRIQVEADLDTSAITKQLADSFNISDKSVLKNFNKQLNSRWTYSVEMGRYQLWTSNNKNLSFRKNSRLKKERYISSAKNDKIRVIPLTDDMARVLRKVKEFEFKNGWLGEYVFQDDRGRVYASRISDCAVNNTTTSEFHNKKSIHAIRRTLNSNMKCAGVSGTVAASLLGHTEKVNEENYTYDVSSMEEKSKFMECAGRV